MGNRSTIKVLKSTYKLLWLLHSMCHMLCSLQFGTECNCRSRMQGAQYRHKVICMGPGQNSIKQRKSTRLPYAYKSGTHVGIHHINVFVSFVLNPWCNYAHESTHLPGLIYLPTRCTESNHIKQRLPQNISRTVKLVLKIRTICHAQDP